MEMSSGEGSLHWSLSEFNELTDRELLYFYEQFVKLTARRNNSLSDAIEAAKLARKPAAP